MSGLWGGVAVGGNSHAPITTTVNIGVRMPVESRYLAHVREIAPEDLKDREEELADLAEWCTAPGSAYAWWHAEAWAGKSAVMSWLVLHPPPGVVIVPFFITARYADHDTREAFIDNVLEQLLAILGKPPPAFESQHTRAGHLLSSMEEVARACQDDGKRLVLLIDGLDEDSTLHKDHRASSIASLLPRDPAGGMRVLVAGRWDPGLPSDVPSGHPLRTASVRELAPSEHAQDIKRRATNELRRLLRGSNLEKDLVGLVAAANGGLTRADLTELTGEEPWRIDNLLDTVTGRTFQHRVGADPDTRVLVLGHDELQNQALADLGETSLRTYRGRLHAWADTYRDQEWPEDTPGYLLHGYPQILTTTDLPRRIDLATDTHRHYARTGGDSAAITELQTAIEDYPSAVDPNDDLEHLVGYLTNPDWIRRVTARYGTPLIAVDHIRRLLRGIGNRSSTRLAQRDDPTAGGSSSPDAGDVRAVVLLTGALDFALALASQRHLPEKALGAYVALGEPDHAMRLAMLDIPDRRDKKLSAIAFACMQQGHAQYAEAASRISDPATRARVFTDLAYRAKEQESGEEVVRLRDKAREAADAISDHESRAGALADAAAVDCGDGSTAVILGAAHAAAGSIVDPKARGATLNRLATTATVTGLRDQAAQFVKEAHAAAAAIRDARFQIPVLAAAVGIGDGETAWQVFTHLIESAANAGIDAPADPGNAIGNEDGDPPHDLTLGTANTVTVSAADGATLLILVATAAGRVGLLDVAAELFRRALQVAESIDHEAIRDSTLSSIATPAAWSREWDVARDAAAAVANESTRFDALIEVAEIAGPAGNTVLASSLRATARSVADGSTDPGLKARALARLAGGDGREQAQSTVRAAYEAAVTIPHVIPHDSALRDVALAAAAANDWATVWVAVDGISDLLNRGETLSIVAARTANHDLVPKLLAAAYGVAQEITDLGDRRQILARVAERAALTDHPDLARTALQAVLDTISAIADIRGQVGTLAQIAGAAAEAGSPELATSLVAAAREATNGLPDLEAPWDALVHAAARAEHGETTREFLTAAHQAAAAISGSLARAHALVQITKEATARGQLDLVPDLVAAAWQAATEIDTSEPRAVAMAQVAAAAAEARDPLVNQILEPAFEAVQHIADPASRARALARVAQAAAATGQHDRARSLIAAARENADRIGEHAIRVMTLEELASASAKAGVWDAAQELANALSDEWQAGAPAEVAKIAAEDGLYIATEIARNIRLDATRAETLAHLARITAKTPSERDRARQLFEEALQALDHVAHHGSMMAGLLANLAKSAAAVGDQARAAQLLDQAYTAVAAAGGTAPQQVAAAAAALGSWPHVALIAATTEHMDPMTHGLCLRLLTTDDLHQIARFHGIDGS